MNKDEFTWIPFYEEFATTLLSFEVARTELVERLRHVFIDQDVKFPKLEEDNDPKDIDPFTVIGLFNKGISEDTRLKIIHGLKESFGIQAEVPTDFDGVPVLNNLNATFYAFRNDNRRGENDIDNLWNIFHSAIDFSDSKREDAKQAFIEAYTRAFGQFGLGWKLTMGLYWVRPNFYLSLDSRNRWFLSDPKNLNDEISKLFQGLKTPPQAKEYTSVLEDVKKALIASGKEYRTFPELTYEAFEVSERVNKEIKEAAKAKAEAETEASNSLGDADVERIHYWMYAPGEAASMWEEYYEEGLMGIGWSGLGDLDQYPSKEAMRQELVKILDSDTSQKNSALATWQFVHDIKPGDVVYARRGRNEILGRGIVESDYIYDESLDHYPNIRKVRWTNKGEWSTPFNQAIKTLTDITDYPKYVADLEALTQGDVEESEPSAKGYPKYSEEDFLDEVFMDDESYASLKDLLLLKKNVILQGAPGVGKTYAAKRLAYSLMGEKDIDRVKMVQFHQSYSYEDFIEGFRPSENGFAIEKGSFYEFCKAAEADGDNDYFFIIDEINRGNLSKIFGELFMLIENDKRGKNNKLQLLYSREMFNVPENVYIIGMMNTADRSLAMIDYALRRRFAFFDMKPGFQSEGFKEYQAELDSESFNKLVRIIEELNEAIAEDESLGDGFAIGHSYLTGFDPKTLSQERFKAVVEYEVVPLLKEYWFDEPTKVEDWSTRLRSAIQ